MDLKPLLPYLPQAEVLPLLEHWLKNEAFDLAIHKPRVTKLGDFRPPKKGARAKITLNSNLGKYQFLTTLVHEIAHLKVKYLWTQGRSAWYRMENYVWSNVI